MRRFYAILAVFAVGILILSASGCETPQGGSSIPWARPEPWEGETNLISVPMD